MPQEANRNLAVVLCSHVFDGSSPALLAIRSSPENENDSGWQLLCNAHQENWEDARICSVAEVIQFEPSLLNYIDLPPGVTISRNDTLSMWKVSQS